MNGAMRRAACGMWNKAIVLSRIPHAASRIGWGRCAVCCGLWVTGCLLWAGVVQAATPCPGNQPLAFPTAEGFGRCAKGGRGGAIIEVTNLNDAGPGSLRACVEASGPRTCVFRIGGTFDLNGTPLRVTAPFLTIAGHTAPGDGILIKNGGNNGNLTIKASQVVVRHVRIRPGISPAGGNNNDAIQIIGNDTSEVSDVIIDHSSFSWGVDETGSLWAWKRGVKYVTYQWNFITEGLNCANHGEPAGECHSTGFLSGGGPAMLTFHHNLLAHHAERGPLINAGSADVVNNVIYNVTSGTSLSASGGPISVNVVKNMYLHGPNSSTRPPVALHDGGSFATASAVYLEGNRDAVFRPDDTLPETAIMFRWGSSPPLPLVSGRLSFPVLPSETSAPEARTRVLASAGATKPVRDAVDARILHEVDTGTGRIIDSPADVGGYPLYRSGTPPADTDHDGMPDSWETAHGLNPANASDGSAVTADGYTNVEHYLNELAGDTGGETGVPGDLTGDDQVTLADLRRLVAMLLGQAAPNDAAKTLATPTDQLTLDDARALIQLLVTGGP